MLDMRLRQNALIVLLVCAVAPTNLLAQDQDTVWTRGIHPFIEPQFEPASSGYGSGFIARVGIDVEAAHFALRATSSYGFIRKVNDNAQVPHEHGHTRKSEGGMFLRKGKTFFGPGAKWSESANTPYRKYSWAPEVVAGRDFGSLRLQGTYFRNQREYTDYPDLVLFTPGPGQTSPSYYCICGNGVAGVNADAWWAPGNRHVLFHYVISITHLHDTVTDPYSSYLTGLQESQQHIAVGVTVGLVIRY